MRLALRKTESNLPPEGRALAREHSLAALTILVHLMMKGKSETIRLAAAGLVLHYADRSSGSTHDTSLIEFFSRLPPDDSGSAV